MVGYPAFSRRGTIWSKQEGSANAPGKKTIVGREDDDGGEGILFREVKGKRIG